MSAQKINTTQDKHRSITSSTVLLLLALFVAVIAAWPILSEPGFLNTRGGGDSPFLLQRLQQLETAIRDGHFPARWMPDANYGYGYPFYNYYAPLSIYIAAAFRLLGFSIIRSIELAQLAGFLTAAWGMFLLARRWLGNEWAGFLASIAYTIAPFHLVNIYVRGDSLAEFWAMALFPWIFLAVDYLLDYKGSSLPYDRMAALAVAYSTLILSHNISALIFSPFLLLYLLLRGLAWLQLGKNQNMDTPDQNQWRIWWATILALLLALALAAWFFIPALAEQDLAQLGPVTSGFFHYSNHFRGLDLVQLTALFDFSVAGGNAFRLGLFQAIFTLLGTVVLIYAAFFKHRLSPLKALYILLALFIATFMITPLSRILWDYLPLLSYTQFPWRFLSLQAFAGSLVIGALAFIPARRILIPIISLILIVGSLFGLKTDHLLLTDEDITSQRLAEYEWFTGNIGSTVSAEYLPLTVQPRPYSSSWLAGGIREDVRALDGELLHARSQEWKTGSQKWQVTTAESGAALIFPTMYWPGWEASVDGQKIDIQSALGSGLILLEVPAGEHIVDLHLGKTKVRWTSEILSLAACLLLLLLLLKARRIPRFSRTAIISMALLFAVLIVLRFWPERSLSASNMTWDFAQMGYLHHDDAGVQFDNDLILNNYEYSHQELAAGETLSIIVNFSGASGEEVEMALGTAAVAWPVFDPDPPLITQQSKTIDNNRVQFDFLLPDNISAGLVIPQLKIEDVRPLTPAGQTRGDIYLQSLRIANSRLSNQSGPELDVRAVQVLPSSQETMEIQLVWITRRQLSQDYNISLRLLDENGSWLSQSDMPPGYGFLPSSRWPVDEYVNDWLSMSLPPELPPGKALPLVLRLYEVGSGEEVLSRRLGEISIEDGQFIFSENQPSFELPDDMMPISIIFGDGIQLHGYQIEQNDADLRLTLYWEALSGSQPDYTRFIHLFDSQAGEIAAQSDGQPQNDSYPTSQWIAGEIVADTTVFDLSDAAPGVYQLGAGFYRQEEESLLHLVPVELQTNTSLPGNRAVLPEVIEWLTLQE